MNENLAKPAKVIAINQNENIIAAAVKMRAEKISCLIVNDEKGRLVGLLTERDIANCVAISPKDLENTIIGQIMTARVVSCPPDTPTGIAREIMAAHGIRHLPIVDSDIVVGIFTARDLMQQQLLEDRAAAKEVAMLSACLKSIDLNEAAEIVTKEVPKYSRQTGARLVYLKTMQRWKYRACQVSMNVCAPRKTFAALLPSIHY